MQAIKKYLKIKPLLPKEVFLFMTAMFAIGIFFLPTPAHAIPIISNVLDIAKAIGEVFTMIIAWPILAWYAILSLGMLIFGFLPVFFASLILNLTVTGHIITLPFTSGGIVDIGWPIVRDLANIIFIAIIIVMAVRTILGQPEKGIRLLPKLIGIALIINFTKVITGVVVDFSNIITNYFLSQVTNVGNLFVGIFGETSPIWRLAVDFIHVFSSFRGLKQIPEAINVVFSNFTPEGLLSNTFAAFALMIVGMIMAVTLLVFAAVFLIRYIAIWLLVIFSPLAFAALILPDTASQFNKWWSSFTKWCFMGVGPAFMLFLVGKLIQGKNDMLKLGQELAGKKVTNNDFLGWVVNSLYDVMNELLFWIIIIILMWTGLLMTLSMNAQINRLVGSKVTGALKTLGKMTARGGWRMARRRLPQTVKKTTQWTGQAVKWTAQKTGAVKAGGWIGRHAPRPWQPIAGSFAKKLKQNTQKDFAKSPNHWMRKAGLMGQKDVHGKTITGSQSWMDLTPDQQKHIMQLRVQQWRENITKPAGRALGKGKGWAKATAKMSWDEILATTTPEEREELLQVIGIKRQKQARKDTLQKHLKNYEEQMLSPEQLSHTLRTASSREQKSALEILIARSGDTDAIQKLAREKIGNIFSQVTITADNTIDTITQKGADAIKELEKLGLEGEILSEFPELIDKLYTEPLKRAKKSRKAIEKSAKDIEGEMKTMEHLDDASLEQLKTGGSRKQKVAVARLYADRHVFEDKFTTSDEQTAAINLARQFKQDQGILKRYLHLIEGYTKPDGTAVSNGQAVKDVVDKMSRDDWREINTKIFEDSAESMFRELFKAISPKQAGDSCRVPANVQAWARKASKGKKDPKYAEALFNDNQDVYEYMHGQRQSPLGVKNWPDLPTPSASTPSSAPATQSQSAPAPKPTPATQTPGPQHPQQLPNTHFATPDPAHPGFSICHMCGAAFTTGTPHP